MSHRSYPLPSLSQVQIPYNWKTPSGTAIHVDLNLGRMDPASKTGPLPGKKTLLAFIQLRLTHQSGIDIRAQIVVGEMS